SGGACRGPFGSACLQRTASQLRCHFAISWSDPHASVRASRIRRSTPLRNDWRVFLHAQRPKRRLCLLGDCVAWRPRLRSIWLTDERDASHGTAMAQDRSWIFRRRDYCDLLGVAPRQSHDCRLEPRRKYEINDLPPVLDPFSFRQTILVAM